MVNIVKISGKQGSGKTEALGAINTSLTGNVLWVNGGSALHAILREIRGRRDMTLLIDECPASLLEALERHCKLAGELHGIERIYAVVDEPQQSQVNAELLAALEAALHWIEDSGELTARGTIDVQARAAIAKAKGGSA